MVEPLPLALHHDYLQYMYHVYVMQTGSNMYHVYEHVVCLNECMFASAVYMKGYASYYVLCIIFLFQHYMHVHVHGAVFLYVWC